MDWTTTAPGQEYDYDEAHHARILQLHRQWHQRKDRHTSRDA